MTRPLIELERIYKVYGQGETQVRALDGLDLEVREGEFVAIMGSSGSGKSTCLNLLACLDTPTAGSYRFRGAEIARFDGDELALLRRAFMGYVFQSFNLLPRTSALENVELPLIYQGVPFRERRLRSYEALAQVGLAQRLDHVPSQLSGGQQQRVAIARALVSRPKVLFADEPTGNLDTATTHEVTRLFQELNAQGLTIVMVTHELDVAQTAARILEFRDGNLIRDLPAVEVAA